MDLCVQYGPLQGSGSVRAVKYPCGHTPAGGGAGGRETRQADAHSPEEMPGAQIRSGLRDRDGEEGAMEGRLRRGDLA